MRCGYNLRGLSSERCPECGLAIDTALSGVIPWERRKGLGYFRSFVRTLGMGTFRPTKLARATGEAIDLRSARIFRWILRGLIVVPIVGLFELAVARNGGLNAVFTIESPTWGQAPQPFWEPRFLWTVGVTLWPVLPIGFVISVILSTGISHWFYMRRLEMVRRNRAMVVNFYLCSPLGWVWVPCAAGAVVLAIPPLASTSQALGDLAMLSVLVCELSSLALVLAILNSIRAIDAATQCGFIRSLVVAVGIALQAGVSCAIGLGLFPVIAGLFRLMITSLWR